MYTKQNVGETVGRKIKLRRKYLNMTQKDLAELLEISFQQVQKYEKGNSCLNISTFLKLCKGLNVGPDYFLKNLAFKDENVEKIEEDLENELLSVFRSVPNEKVKKKILNLIKALVSNPDE